MMTVGNVNVTWEQLFMTLYTSVMNMLYELGGVPDWDEPAEDGLTYAQLAMRNALDRKMYFVATYHGADDLGITLSEQDLADIQSDFESYAAEQGGEQVFMAMLWEVEGIRNREMFDYMFGANTLMLAIFATAFGENGEFLSDEAVAAHTADDGYLMAKQIMLVKYEDESEESWQLEAIEEILQLLQEYDGGDFEGYFTEIMHEVSMDPELEYFPNGYLFRYDEFPEEFSSITASLEPGGISGIWETDYSFHIILRLPIDYDAIPLEYIDSQEYYSLRYATAVAMFDELFETWINSLTPEYTPEFHTIDFSILFQPDN